MAHELEVWLFADCVGTLALVDGRLSFRYADDWLKRPNAVALSCSLPLQAEPFDDHQARPFFAGLLPEGQLRRLIAQQLQVSGQNDFALLDRIGGECAGAVTFLEPGNSTNPAGDGEIEWLSDDAVIALLDELPRRPMLAGRDGLRLSLAGAQDKLPVVVDGDRSVCPVTARPAPIYSSRPFTGSRTASPTRGSAWRWLKPCSSRPLAPVSDRSVIAGFFWWSAMIERATGQAGFTACTRKTSARRWAWCPK